MTTAAEQFGRNFRAVRLRAGLPQEDVHMAAGVHRTAISKLDRGKGGPNVEAIVCLARFFEVPVGGFFVEMEPAAEADEPAS